MGEPHSRSQRERLPSRRASDLINFIHDEIKYTASVSRFDDGRIAEIFIDAGKVDSAVDIIARDSAIAASLAFQHGCSVDELRSALTRLTYGSPAGPLGVLLDLIESRPAFASDANQ